MKMIWSIGEWNESEMKVDEDRRAVTLEGEQLSDGVHRVIFRHLGVQESRHCIVKGGEWCPTTEIFIGDMVESVGYHGPYIEGFEIINNQTEGKCISVCIGS